MGIGDWGLGIFWVKMEHTPRIYNLFNEKFLQFSFSSVLTLYGKKCILFLPESIRYSGSRKNTWHGLYRSLWFAARWYHTRIGRDGFDGSLAGYAGLALLLIISSITYRANAIWIYSIKDYCIKVRIRAMLVRQQRSQNVTLKNILKTGLYCPHYRYGVI